jgi:small subunit ribosomal protein S13
LARISGVDLPKNKKILFGLQYIFGIGHSASAEILEKAKIDPNKRVSDLTEEEVAEISSVITADFKVEGALRSEVQQNIKRLMDIGAYRGLRHRKGLACSRSKNPYKFPNQKRQEKNCCWQEKNTI